MALGHVGKQNQEEIQFLSWDLRSHSAVEENRLGKEKHDSATCFSEVIYIQQSFVSELIVHWWNLDSVCLWSQWSKLSVKSKIPHCLLINITESSHLPRGGWWSSLSWLWSRWHASKGLWISHSATCIVVLASDMPNEKENTPAANFTFPALSMLLP